MEPSPTAEATRLTEPERTSPAANTPGRLVSSRNGCRFNVQCGESTKSIPVRTKFFSSFSLSAGRLPCGVAAANEHDIRPTTHFNFIRRGRIINTAAFELAAAFDLEASIFRAGGDEQTFCRDSLPVLQLKN